MSDDKIEKESSPTEEFSQVKSKFPYHAAVFSIFAPIMVILLNVGSNMVKPPPPTPFIIALIGLIVFITAFVMGIVALCFIRKYGKDGILVRSILGIIINAVIITMVIVSIPAVKKSIEIEKKMNRYQFIPPPGFTRNDNLIQGMPNAFEAYVNGDINDSKSDIVLIIEDVKVALDKNEDVSGLTEGKPHIQNFKMRWKNHDINVFRIEEKVNNTATLTYNALIPVIPAIQIRLMGLEARDQELKEILKTAIKGASGKSNWD